MSQQLVDSQPAWSGGDEGGVRAEVRAWLADNWDPDLTVGEWWERLAGSGWAVPMWPEEYRDRFVITNQRVFRVNGVLSTARASVPLLRILDITVNKPVIGRWLNYGHFVFESAAQVQGLNKITFVGDIDQREDVLRIVMQGDLPQQIATPAEDDGT
jgi:hypothetical protein